MPTPFLFFLRFLGKQELEFAASECQRRRLAIAKLVLISFDHLWPHVVTPASKSHYIPSAFRVAILTSGTSGLVGTARRRTFKKTVRNAAPIMTRPKFAGTSGEILSLCSPSLRLLLLCGCQLLRLIPTRVLGKERRCVRALVCCCLASCRFLRDVLFGAHSSASGLISFDDPWNITLNIPGR